MASKIFTFLLTSRWFSLSVFGNIRYLTGTCHFTFFQKFEVNFLRPVPESIKQNHRQVLLFQVMFDHLLPSVTWSRWLRFGKTISRQIDQVPVAEFTRIGYGGGN